MLIPPLRTELSKVNVFYHGWNKLRNDTKGNIPRISQGYPVHFAGRKLLCIQYSVIKTVVSEIKLRPWWKTLSAFRCANCRPATGKLTVLADHEWPVGNWASHFLILVRPKQFGRCSTFSQNSLSMHENDCTQCLCTKCFRDFTFTVSTFCTSLFL